MSEIMQITGNTTHRLSIDDTRNHTPRLDVTRHDETPYARTVNGIEKHENTIRIDGP